MKILITGTSGQVGFELVRTLSLFGELITPKRHDLDLSDLAAVQSYITNCKPDLIVNAAAWTAVDKAEEQSLQAHCINAGLPKLLAQYAAQKSIWLIHYSSDYVYKGDGDKLWSEEDKAEPLSAYGKSKLAGDEAIQEYLDNYLILRTSWVYSARGSNFMKTMLRLAKERESLNIVNDQFGSPTPARLIAEVTALAVYKLILGSPIDSGIYHLAPKGKTSWYDFAQGIFTLARQKGYELNVQPNTVKGIPTQQYPTPAVRPKNSCLNLDAIEAALNIQLPDWKTQLDITLNEYLD
jgi:dTDP-4-dehydrorhamnose reductase